MLRRSFIFLPGIGPRRERVLWQRGITDWGRYLDDLATPRRGGGLPLDPEQRRVHRHLISRAIAAADRRDRAHLAGLLPPAEHWRFYGPEAPRVGCLDIETTGTHRAHPVTVVGVHNPADGTTRQLVRGRDLDHANLRGILADYDLLVTFNGNGFDLPVLRAHYPGAVPAVPHLDLRGPLARLGYKGGLKRIEHDLGLRRPDELVGIDGYEAVRLWRRHEHGDRHALDTLLAYNAEDILHLGPLARFAAVCHRNRYAGYWGEPILPIPWPAGVRPPDVPRGLAAVQDTLPG